MEKLEANHQSLTHDESPGKLILTEDEALAQRRRDPSKSEPIYIAFGPDDKDNPRNWGTARKYYVSSFASALNAIT